MKTTELVQLLAELALKNYRDRIRPDPFTAVSTMIGLSKFSAYQAALTTEARNAMDSGAS